MTGVVALMLAVVWYWKTWSEGFQFPPVPFGDIADVGRFYAFGLLALTFEFGVPLSCLVSALFGLPARSEVTARIGLTCALVALLMYAFYIRSCSRALFG